MKIYDVQGVERDAAWLKATFGAVVVAGQSAQRFVLSEVRVTEGPATALATVQTADGRLLKDHAIAFAWPDGPDDLTTPQAQVFRTRHKPWAKVQWTDSNGITGFGLGTGAYIQDLAQGGPHALWVLHDLYESDVLDRVGMLGGTNHVGPLRLLWTLELAAPGPGDAGGSTPPVPPSADTLAALNRIAVALEGVAGVLGKLATHLGA